MTTYGRVMIRPPQLSAWRLMSVLPLAAALLLTGQPASAAPVVTATRPTGPQRPGSPSATPPADSPGYDWQLVWRDDFEGRAGSPVNTSAWLHDVGTCYPGCPAENWGTGEIGVATASTRNVALDGKGHLLITPVRDAADPTKWTTGRIETRRSDFRAEKGGALRVEARMALPQVSGAQAKGLWSAFWMLGSTFRDKYRDDSGAGDVDIMEHINADPEIIGTAHCNPPNGDPCNEIPDHVGLAGQTTCPPAGCLSGFHTYGVELHREVTPERMDWTVDGKVYHSIRADQPGMDEASWKLIVDRSFFIILNVSVGGSWPGQPTLETASGKPLVVDFVAVWKLAVQAPKRPHVDPKGAGCTAKGHSDGHSSGHSDRDRTRSCSDQKGSQHKKAPSAKKSGHDTKTSHDTKASPVVRHTPRSDDERTHSCGHPRHA